MRFPFLAWAPEIEEYCLRNQLSFEKAKHLPKSFDENHLFLQYCDHSKKNAVMDSTPAPIVLRVTKENGKLNFEQTEYTKKYLGM